MLDYETWNRALIAYFVDEVPPGAPVFLAVDDAALTRIGQRLTAIDTTSVDAADPSSDAVESFRQAVRSRVARTDDRIDLAGLTETASGEEPQCAAFLGALVLAASRMSDAGDFDDVNYFGRLSEVLDLTGSGRPGGMRLGKDSEEPLWRIWNFWLQIRARLPTAVAGEGPQRFIHYARSQALLRDVDKDRLWRLFQEKGWHNALDAETLLLRVRREAPYLTVQLRELLGSDSQRLQALAEAIHELYEGWRQAPTSGHSQRGGRSRTLYAGLYREEDVLSGAVAYHLYPRAPRGGTSTTLGIRTAGALETLRPERQGWFYPLGPVDGATLSAGGHYPVEQPAEIEEIVLPQRDFWILTPDPDMPESGVYATWGAPQLGLPFILLCQQTVVDQFREMQQEQLVECRGEPAAVLDGNWCEWRDCLVISEAWSGAHFQNPELYDALRPTDTCNVSASGGLRLPHQPGWLDQAGPDITVFGFPSEAQIRITDASGQVILEREQPTNQPVAFAWPKPGTYLVTADCAGQTARRLVTIVSWDDLRLSYQQRREAITIAGAHVCGAAFD